MVLPTARHNQGYTTMREHESTSGGDDTETTLGVGKMLGLFFGLVILCGLSLGTGFWLGRNSMNPTASAMPAAAPGATASAARKPGAAQPAKTTDCAAGTNCPGADPSDLTFYKAVRQPDNSHPRLAPPPAAPVARAASNAHGTLGGGYLVQIAAVRNQGDANLLSETLRKQQYPVLISQPGDNLYHVQVGPYADIKEAEAIRARLLSEGYNPFLKH
jgi:DedD protein